MNANLPKTAHGRCWEAKTAKTASSILEIKIYRYEMLLCSTGEHMIYKSLMQLNENGNLCG